MSDIQAQTDLFFVRREMAEAEPPPRSTVGPIAWLRDNLFGSIGDTILTFLGVLIVLAALPPLIDWAFLSAVWEGENREACISPEAGACWAFVKAKFAQFIYGRYPVPERWRVDLVLLLLAGGILPMAIPSVPRKGLNALFLFAIFPVVAFILLVGGVLGLRPVETSLWGGLMVTLVVSYVGIVASLPLGILLALGRRSKMPIVRTLCITFIEIVRGVPLITVLFMASVMLPLFLPPGVNFDKLLRALIGVALFSAAYMAEVVRGGLQAIPKGQYEAAQALGLGYWKTMRLIVLPQALKIVIPGIVNTFIGGFKDTSLVYIIGLFDLLGIVRLNFADTNWASWQTPATGLVFAAFVFWMFCFGMSRYSQFMERRLNTGHKR
jgi:general L-amino acid transport system permease protein